jgi:hypothetical protein
MKVKILIGVICFVVGAGAYYLYENNFSHSSKVEKCADEYFVKNIDGKVIWIGDSTREFQQKIPIPSKVDSPEKLKIYLNSSVKEKLGLIPYIGVYNDCVKYAKKWPEVFNKKY